MFDFIKRRKRKLKADFGKIKTDGFNLSGIARFFLLSEKSDAHQIISDRTWQDLDMDEVFMFTDRTSSKIGQQYLYYILRTIPKTDHRRERLDKLTITFQQNQELRDRVLYELAGLNDPSAYHIVTLFLTEHIRKPSWFWIIPVLSSSSVISALLTPFYPSFLLLLTLLLGINFIIHYWNKTNLNSYTASIPQMLIMNRVARKLTKFAELSDHRTEVNAALNKLEGLGARMIIFRIESGLQSEIAAFAHYAAELLKALFLIEPLVLFDVLKRFDSMRSEMNEVFEFVGEIDLALSMSALRGQVPYYCQPVFASGPKVLSGEAIYHPMIHGFVANSLENSGKSILLTGSNMSGKTTFIRTLGVNVLLSQTIGLAFARNFTLSRLRVHSAISILDDLFDDKSYYFEEVLTIKSMLTESKAGSGNLFLLDELFRGTNTLERIAAGKAVLEYLSSGENLVVVSTHDLELTNYLKESFSLYHFAEKIENDKITFDYKLKPGNLETTNAIRILDIHDYPNELITEALRLSEEMKRQKKENDRHPQ